MTLKFRIRNIGKVPDNNVWIHDRRFHIDLSIISRLYLLRGGKLLLQDRILRGDELIEEIKK